MSSFNSFDDSAIEGVNVDITGSVNACKVATLLDGSNSEDMRVDGSVTPVSFRFTPSAGEIWNIVEISIIMGCSGDPNSDKFGSITALTNGMELGYQTKGNGVVISNMKNSIGITKVFNTGHQIGVTDSKWFKDVLGRYFFGTIKIGPHIELHGDSGDYVEALVQDDLSSGFSFLSLSMQIWRRL